VAHREFAAAVKISSDTARCLVCLQYLSLLYFIAAQFSISLFNTQHHTVFMRQLNFLLITLLIFTNVICF